MGVQCPAFKKQSMHSHSEQLGVSFRKTPDGSAYTLDFPWGNTGSILNGVCLSAVYQKLAIDPATSEDSADNRCFIQRQLGYFFNHKCSTSGSACDTPTEEGFSYMVGCDMLARRMLNRIVNPLRLKHPSTEVFGIALNRSVYAVSATTTQSICTAGTLHTQAS